MQTLFLRGRRWGKRVLSLGFTFARRNLTSIQAHFNKKSGECSYNFQRHTPNPIMGWNFPYPHCALALPNCKDYLLRWLLVTLMKCFNLLWLSGKKLVFGTRLNKTWEIQERGRNHSLDETTIRVWNLCLITFPVESFEEETIFD